jgi:hypothetical protein
MDEYSEAHLIVAAIRILQHQKGTPPKLEEVCTMLGISDEEGHTVSRKLAKIGVIDTLEGPFSLSLSVANHLEIEKISQDVTEGKGLALELERFQAKKTKAEKKVADIQAEIEKKKKDRLASIEAEFKKKMEQYKKN